LLTGVLPPRIAPLRHFVSIAACLLYASLLVKGFMEKEKGVTALQQVKLALCKRMANTP